MAENKNNTNQKKDDELQSIKRAAANKAVSGAASFGANAGHMAATAGRAVINGIKSVGGAFAKGFGLVTGKVSLVGSAIGLSPLASNLLAVVLVMVCGTTATTAIQDAKYLEDLQYNTVWDDEDPCAGFEVEDAGGEFDIDDSEAAKMQTVRQIWSFAHWYAQRYSDMSWDEVDIRVAGMIGCFAHEGGLMPASIEGKYSSEQINELLRDLTSGTSTGAIKVDSQTYAVLNNMNLSAYSAYSDPIAHSHSAGFYQFEASESMTMGTSGHTLAVIHGDGGYYAGLGLGQVTGPRAIGLLVYADMAGVAWYEAPCQLAYMVAGDDPYYTSGAVIPYLTKTHSTHGGSYNCDKTYTNVQDATMCWATNYESGDSTLSSCATRIQSAEQWYNVMKMWSQSSIDQSTINSVCDILNKTTGAADFDASMEVMGDCGEVTGLGNLTLAEYASLASYDGRMSNIYSGQRLGHYDNGTPLYQYVVMNCNVVPRHPSDPYLFQDCGKGVASIVRWAGADDNMPCGTKWMEQYCDHHPEIWQEVTDWNDIQPGDVFIVNSGKHHHTYIYCGEEAWLKFHLGPNDEDPTGHSYCSITYDSGDVVHGGQTVEVPVPRTINTSCSSSFTPDGHSDSSCSMSGQGTNFASARRMGYRVFRNIKPEENSQYAYIVDLDRLVVGANQDGHVSTSVVANGSLVGGHNTQCTILPDYTWVDSSGAEVVIQERYHFSWMSVRSNMHGSDDNINGCPDYVLGYAADYNIHPADDTVAHNST